MFGRGHLGDILFKGKLQGWLFDVCIRGVGDFCIFLWALTGHWLSKATNNNLKIWFEFRGAEFGLAPLSVEDVESAFSWGSGRAVEFLDDLTLGGFCHE